MSCEPSESTTEIDIFKGLASRSIAPILASGRKDHADHILSHPIPVKYHMGRADAIRTYRTYRHFLLSHVNVVWKLTMLERYSNFLIDSKVSFQLI